MSRPRAVGLLVVPLCAVLTACDVIGGLSAAKMHGIAYAQLLAPAFRTNPAARHLVDYRTASRAFPSSLGETGFLPPERLSDSRIFAKLGGRAPLDRSFASGVYGGYRFAFEGIGCEIAPRIVRDLGTLCGGYVYSAIPDSSTHAPAFALFSADERIHVRDDGARPTREDPIADNTEPSSAADVPVQSAALHEQIAISDLKELLAAENTYVTMKARGYVTPATLADESLLEAYFAQPLRLGYRYDFSGGKRLPGARADESSQAFESWSYSAVPLEPGPKGRRSFTLFSNGALRVASGGRAATESDPFLSAK